MKSAVVMAAAGLVGGAWLTAGYRRDVAVQRGRLDGLDVRTVTTSVGDVKYVEYGKGPPVLAVHGIAGGHDQGTEWAGAYLPEGFRVVAPSRFGYLGSAMPPQATPALQADVLAELLDALGIERAGVIGFSAGATSAVQFGLRHPTRVSGLVLSSPNAPGPVGALPPRGLMELAVRTDVPFWVLVRFFRRLMTAPMLGVPKDYPLTNRDRADLDQIARKVLPITARRQGFLFDMFVSNPDINHGYHFEDISVPTLVISAMDDAMAPYPNARAMAQAIPGARLLTIERGGHPLFGASELVGHELRRFLTSRPATPLGPVAHALSAE